MMRRSLMLVIAAGLATLGSSLAWSEDSDQPALIKALNGAKLTLLARSWLLGRKFAVASPYSK